MFDLIHPPETPLDFVKKCRAIYWGKLNEVFPKDKASSKFLKTLRKTDANTSGATTLRFILWTHKPENQKNVIPLLEDCDILAIEDCRDAVFKTKKEINAEITSLEELYLSITTIFNNPATTDKQKLKLLRKHELFVLDSKEILENCVGKVEQIAKLDVGPDKAKGLATLDRSLLKRKDELDKAVSNPINSWGNLKECVLAVGNAYVEINTYREAIIAAQLKQLVKDNPRKTIAVLTGRSHHTLSRQFDTSEIQIQRFFTTDETAKDSPAHRTQWVNNSLILTDSLRIDHQATYELGQIILYEIVNYYGLYEMLFPLGELGLKQRKELAKQLQKIWQKPIFKNQPNTNEKIQKRTQATWQLLQSILSAKN